MPNSHLALEAAKEGCGLAVGSTILCADDLRRGTLVKVLDLEIPAPHPYFVIRPGDAPGPLADAFADLLIEQLERA
jgi:LysR family glycine cleavage system transcriptional activator